MPDDNSVFISYAHQDSNATRVAGFTQFLHDNLPNRITLLLDRKFLGIGKNIPNYMQRLRTCPVAVVLLTPEYKRRAETSVGGVFTEFDVIRSRLLDETDDFVCLPVLFEGTATSAVPQIFADNLYEDFTGFHPRVAGETRKKYLLSDTLRQQFIPKFTAIARAIEARIAVRSAVPRDKLERLLEELFAHTKITREWLALHPEFSNHLFVSTRSYNRIKSQAALFLIGRKGSGKSTVANTLPDLEHERYKTSIPISAEHINLLETFAFLGEAPLDTSLTTLRQRFGASAEEYTQLNPTQFLFKYAWLGLFYVCLANELCRLGSAGKLNQQQTDHYTILSAEFDRFTHAQSQNGRSEKSNAIEGLKLA